MSANHAHDHPALTESVDVRARRRLRELRTERGLTLQQVAERASIDVSTLSRLESGKRRLALDHIAALAPALGVTTDDLLGSASPQDPRVRNEPIRFDDMTMWPLTRPGTAATLRAFKINISAARTTPPQERPIHPGHEWMYVIRGRLRLLLGDVEHVIEEGDAVEFPTTKTHWFGAIDGPVEVIGIFSAQGEREHLHA